MKKVQNVVFSLDSIAGRVALLTGIVAGTVGKAEIRAAVLADVQPRKMRKPVVAWNRRFESVTDAAHWGYRKHPESHGRVQADYHAVIERMRKNVAKWATADNVPGFFWTE